jgi:prepilin-type N-terminal cleavage/methylation domain-containing protein
MNKAFTLIELAIVIVVLGIMSAVIVGGKTIVDSANMNSTISQINQYRLAHNAFVLEYDAIPGDMKDANNLLILSYYFQQLILGSLFQHFFCSHNYYLVFL